CSLAFHRLAGGVFRRQPEFRGRLRPRTDHDETRDECGTPRCIFRVSVLVDCSAPHSDALCATSIRWLRDFLTTPTLTTVRVCPLLQKEGILALESVTYI